VQLLSQQFVGALQFEVTHQKSFDAFGDLFDVVLSFAWEWRYEVRIVD
jgi:hypothetical protein